MDCKLVADLASLRFVAEAAAAAARPARLRQELSRDRAGHPRGRGRLPRLLHLRRRPVATIAAAYADGTFATKIRTYTGPSVLVIDDVALTPWTAAGNAFFQVINRYDNNSTTIVTTNRGLPAWGELFGDPVGRRHPGPAAAPGCGHQHQGPKLAPARAPSPGRPDTTGGGS